MLTVRTLIGLMILIVSTNSLACFPAKISLEDRFANSTDIFIGQVDKRSNMQNDNAPISSVTTISSSVAPYQLSVTITEVLKGGSSQKIIYPQILNCGSGEGSVGDKVIIYYDGQYWFTSIYQADIYQKIKLLR